ncbi:hypothetical protein BBJ28_00022922 [Nothophytophthora sp. Chile5]|nr:hypothetical protein BBJ28_00022922 [Nothophytophthora sp. Chile5]
MTKAKQQTPRNGGDTPKGTTPRDAEATAAVQLSVLVIQADALEHDEAVRQELKKAGFVVKQQTLVHLSMDAARQFVLEVCNPRSVLYQSPLSSAVDGEAHATSASEGEADHAAARALAKPEAPDDDRETAEFAIQALAGGPAVVLALEKPQAIAELLELVGADDLAAWTDSSASCLRARFAKAPPRQLGLRCSLQERTAAQELAFLLTHSGSKSHSSAVPVEGRASGGSPLLRKRSALMALDQLQSFLFPAHVQHPNSAGRLFVFALYGPLDAHSRLRSGEKGRHVVTDGELATLATYMEREDILAVYEMCSLSQEEEEEVVRQVDHTLKSFPQYTPRDITALFASLPRDPQGALSFHDMQRVVLKERLRRVLCMKQRLHPALAAPIRNRFARTLTRMAAAKGGSEGGGVVNGAPASLFLKDVGATDAENATLVTRLLSSHAFRICQLQDGNAPELTQNVRLLRDERARQSQEREPWSANCQRRK